MVQVITPTQQKRNFGGEIGAALGGGLSQGYMAEKERQQTAEALRGKQSHEMRLKEREQELRGQNIQNKEETAFQNRLKLQEHKAKLFSDLVGGKQTQRAQQSSETPESEQGRMVAQELGLNPSQIDDQAIIAASALDPALGRALSSVRDNALKEKRAERSYHSDYTRKEEEKVNQLRESVPRKEMALDFSRNAVQTGNTSFFSPDKLADATGIDLFRTAKGAQLIAASKENLLSNMSRVSAKAQNQWFEQRLSSVFPKIGQSDEANLTVQEMIEAEVAMDKAYLDEFDRLSEEDEKNYGYVRKDITKRARAAVRPHETHIMRRATHRMKEVEEQENGLSAMKKEVGKNVSKGTPLTLAMAKLYVDKFGKENALSVAEKNGYYIPTKDEFVSFQKVPREFREGFE